MGKKKIGCSLGICYVEGLLQDKDVDTIINLHQMLGKEEPVPYYTNGCKYLGIVSQGEPSCKHCFPYGYGYYCDKHVLIKKYLEQKGKKQ